MPADEVQAVSDNLVQALRFFGRAHPNAEIRDQPGLVLIFCGLNYAAFNAALLTKPVHDDPKELERLIQVSAAQFEARRLRWTYWLCADYLGHAVAQKAPQIFDRRSLRLLTKAPGMYTERLAGPARALPALEVLPVADEKTRAIFAELMSVAFEIPHSVSNSVYAAERAWCGDFHGYLGFANGKAVTSAATVITGDTIGLYSVATLPQHRRLGFAEAIMRHVIAEAREKQGVQRTVLQATSSGLSLYATMGYRSVTNFDVYIAD